MAYSDVILATSGLVHYHRLDETSGTTVADSQGTATGTVSGATLGATSLLASGAGKAISFDGTNDSITAGDVADFTGTASCSWEFLYNPSIRDATYRRIVAKDDATNGYLFTFHNTRGIAITRYGAGGNETASYSTGVVGTTYHVVATYDGANLRLYVNGVIRQTVAATRSVGDNSMPLTYGKASDFAGAYFGGRLDEVSIYNVALSATDVTNHYNAFRAVELASALEGTSTIAADLTAPKPLATALAGTSDLAAALTVPKPLASIIGTTSSIDANLSVAGAGSSLGAVLGASSTVTGALVVPKPLATTISVTSSLTTVLTAPKPLATTLAATSSLTTTLTAPKPLTSTVSAEASLASALTVLKPLATTLGASSSVAAALTAPKPLATTIAASSSVTGALQVSAWVSLISGQAALSAALTVQKPLASLVAANAVVSGNLQFLTTAITYDGIFDGRLGGTITDTRSLRGRIRDSQSLRGQIRESA